jgi:uncharacterized protein YbjT (DUF2867 family)
MSKKIIAVAGATGAQGGGLARAILADPDGPFAVRALTRTPGSEKAQALAAAGAEVVQANVDDVDAMTRAYEGAYGAYCVTFFWEHLSAEHEKAQARNQAIAAKNAGLRHVIWSTLEDTRLSIPLDDDRMPTLQGKYKVPHFDAKGESDVYFTERSLPVTIFYTSFYWENFIVFGMGPKPGPDGKLTLTFPIGDKQLPSVAAEDIGRCALSVYERGAEFIGKSVGVAGEHMTGARMAAEMTEAFGRQVAYNAMTPDAYRGLKFPGAEELGNMFQFNAEFQNLCCNNRPLDLSRQLNPKLQTFAQWLAAHKDRIPLS